MKLRRWAAVRNHGTWTIFHDTEPSIDLTYNTNDKFNVIGLTVTDINDESGNCQHNYEVLLNVNDINRILELLSNNLGISYLEKFREKLPEASRSLLRLLCASSGMVDPPKD